ncbi:MAG: pyruvate ferredoxin oxidoreductase [Ruminococcaceae bacterium]|nr:pyruvate ferredoxin oxidoreductase [Oscillospiraceae bacterium]
MFNIIIAGVGGQGTVLASKIICAAAVKSGKYVVSSETIGMAQRGGSVVSHIRINEEEVVCSPLIDAGGADMIIAFEPAEGVRALPFLKKGGRMVVATGIIPPITKYDYDKQKLFNFLAENVTDLKLVDGAAVCEACGSSRVLNMVLVGAAEKFLPFGGIEETIKESVKPKFVEMNLKAIEGGRKL